MPFGAITQDHEEEYIPGSQTCERFGGILFFPYSFPFQFFDFRFPPLTAYLGKDGFCWVPGAEGEQWRFPFSPRDA